MAVSTSERGSLHSGLGEWVIQRLTAVYLLFYILFAVVRFSVDPVTTQDDWALLSSGMLFQISLLLFIFSLLTHVWLGLKSVFLDYVHPWRLRFLLLICVAVLLFAAGLWALLVVIH